MKIDARLKQAIIAGGNGGKISFDEYLAGHSTIGIGGRVAALFRPDSEDELASAVRIMGQNGIDFFVLGNGSNILFPDSTVDRVAVKLSSPGFRALRFGDGSVFCGAGLRLSELISGCAVHGLSGMEGLVGIPGTVGGAIRNNAGYMSEISDRLTKIRLMGPDGETGWMDRNDIGFGYRGSSIKNGQIITGAEFALSADDRDLIENRLRKYFISKLDSQPYGKKTLGCVFKNPPAGSGLSSSRLIDECGLKGARCGNAVVSIKHANFIINSGGASSKDVMALIEKMRGTVKKRHSIDMDLEIEIIQ